MSTVLEVEDIGRPRILRLNCPDSKSALNGELLDALFANLLSVFVAPGDDLIALSEMVSPIRRQPEVRVVRCGVLRESGFEVAATFSNPPFLGRSAGCDGLHLRPAPILLL